MNDVAPSLANELMSLPQTETGGLIASDRFDYQKDWTLCKLLELHESGIDYVILCEFHEDVLIVDHPSEPSSVVFYQIKTDQKNSWTVNRLIRRGKGKSGPLPSILGKLCGKKITVDTCTALYRFSSNARYSIDTLDGRPHDDISAFKLSQLEQTEMTKLVAALSAELQEAPSDKLLDAVQLEVGLSLQSHAEITTGKLAAFVESYAPGCSIPVQTFYRAVFDEIKRKTAAPRPSSSFPDVCSSKGISRNAFNQMLSGAAKNLPVDRLWLLVMQDLTSQGVPLVVRRGLDRGLRQCFVRQLNPEDLSLVALRKQVATAILKLLDERPNLTLMELANILLEQLEASKEFANAALSRNEFLAMVMLEAYEGQQPEIPTIDTKSSEEQP